MTYRTAKTVAAIATGTDADVALIKQRNVPLTASLVAAVVARSQCHYAGRRPKAPTKTPTDMDLASYLLALSQRQAVVAIDSYERLTPRVDQADVRHVGDVRFGHVVGLVSHREYLSFGLRLLDASVVGSDGYTEAVGQPRSFTLLAPNGAWHTKPARLSWRERWDEAEFNRVHQLSLADIQHFVHRNRAESVMGSPYLAAKCLLVRLEDEIEHFRKPPQAFGVSSIKRHVDVASEIVPSFTMGLEGFSLTGDYPYDICSFQHLNQLCQWRQLVQWVVRIDEYAFYRYGLVGSYTAPWVRGTTWQPTGEGQARLALHPDLALTYHLRYVSRATVAKAVPLAALAQAR